MKTASTFLTLIVFLSSLTFGYWTGGYFASLPVNHPTPLQPATLPTPLPTTDHGQRILLVISADRLDIPRPLLKGIWMLTYFKPPSQIGLIPVYPSFLGEKVEVDSAFTKNFGLVFTKEGPSLNPRFLRTLREHNLWWSGYLVLDEIAVQVLLEQLQGQPAQDPANLPLTASAASKEGLPQNDPVAFYLRQIKFFDQLCGDTQNIQSRIDWAKALERYSMHILTDLNTEQLLVEWKALLEQPGGLRCNFPLLSTTP